MSLPSHKDTEDSEDKDTADFESDNIDDAFVGLTNNLFLNTELSLEFLETWREEGFIHSFIANLLRKM